MKKLILLVIFLVVPTFALAQYDTNSNPYSYENNPYNYENNPYNYDNSPYNYDNSPYKHNNDRIIRDNDGKDTGLYSVPRSDGGYNIFDRKGKRKGYKPGN